MKIISFFHFSSTFCILPFFLQKHQISKFQFHFVPGIISFSRVAFHFISLLFEKFLSKRLILYSFQTFCFRSLYSLLHGQGAFVTQSVENHSHYSGQSGMPLGFYFVQDVSWVFTFLFSCESRSRHLWPFFLIFTVLQLLGRFVHLQIAFSICK